VLAVSVGNTSIKYAVVKDRAAESYASAPVAGPAAAEKILALRAGWEEAAGDSAERTPVVLATVNVPAADALESQLRRAGVEVLRLGRDLPIRITHSLDDATTVGADRLLNAMAAHSGAGGACVIIDCGTAVTVDFVDGEGVFHGGAIAPGVRMMLRAMHEHTAALPLIDISAGGDKPVAESAISDGAGSEKAEAVFPPDPVRGPFGKDTRHAMLLGVAAAVRGMAHDLIDRYAEFYEAYPRVVATGGDAAALFTGDELVERIVPELTILGIGEACRRALDNEDEEDGEDGP
jgi:type III pantothenate kinase